MMNILQVYVPPQEEVSDDELERRLVRLYGGERAGLMMGYIRYALQQGWTSLAQMEREK